MRRRAQPAGGLPPHKSTRLQEGSAIQRELPPSTAPTKSQAIWNNLSLHMRPKEALGQPRKANWEPWERRRCPGSREKPTRYSAR